MRRLEKVMVNFFFFSSRRRHTRFDCDWSSDVCSSDLIIAGGASALQRSVEGAEDEGSNGALAIDRRGIKDVDVVIGITASGRTPFVLGALARAKSLGAKTILLTCNPARAVAAGPPRDESVSPATAGAGADTAATAVIADLAIDLAVGPEILTGSTRLKAGTATKVALNIISTGA